MITILQRLETGTYLAKVKYACTCESKVMKFANLRQLLDSGPVMERAYCPPCSAANWEAFLAIEKARKQSSSKSSTHPWSLE